MGFLDRWREPTGFPQVADRDLTVGLALSDEPVRRRSPFLRGLTAAATRLDLSESPTRQGPEPGKTTEVQERCWRFYDAVNLIKFPYNASADAAGRVRMFPAVRETPGSDPVPIEDAVGEVEGITQSLADTAVALFAQVQGQFGGRPELQRLGVLGLKVPGEYRMLVEQPEGEPVVMSVLSSSALAKRSGRWYVLQGPEDRKGRELDPDRSYVFRVWKQHPRWPGLADSHLRAVMDDVEELLLQKAGNRAIASSRLAMAGMIAVDQSILPGAMNPQEMGASDDPEDIDPFTQQFGNALMTAIRDPGSASAVVPLILLLDGLGGQPIDHYIKQVQYERPHGEEHVARYAQIEKDIAWGIDAAPEFVFGLGDSSTFANARLVSRESYRQHLEPPVNIVADGFNAGWLQPALEELGFDASRVLVGVDPSSILSQPEPVMAKSSAIEMWLAGQVRKNEVRADYGLDALEKDEGGEDFVTPEEVALYKGKPDQASVPAEDNPNPDGLGASALIAIEASAVVKDPKLTALGPKLAKIDAALLDRLVTASDDAVEGALRLAASRLRGKAARAGLTKGIPAADTVGTRLFAALGPDTVTRLQGETDPLFADAFTPLAAKWAAWVGLAQRQTLDAVDRAGGDFDRDEWETRQQTQRDDGWAVLSAALLAVATGRIFTPTLELPDQGELPAGISIPVSPIRQAIQVAGGAPASAVDTSGGGILIGEAPAGGIATGVDAEALVREALRAEFTGFVWMWGGSDRPFPPHEQLDGVFFRTWTDDVLAADPGEFPYVEHSRIFDHAGCLCGWSPAIEVAAA